MVVGFFEGIARDLTGKGQFRLILQPAFAVLLGIRLGVADAKEDKAPFVYRLCMERHGRWALLTQSCSDALLPLALALVMDGVFQYLTLGHIRPLAALVVGAILVWFPFVSSRGLTNRFWRRSHPRPA